jgi:DNA topoisomerase-2
MVRDYTDMSTDKVVDITIHLAKGSIEILESETHEYGLNGIEKSFKLYTTNTTSNMHMFDAAEKLKLYKNVYEIMDDYFDTRMAVYVKRKQYIIDSLNAELVVLSNRARYIQENLDETIDLRRKKKNEIITLLKSKNYDMVDEDEDYKYLVKMPMDSVSEENVAKIMKSHEDKIKELELCITTTESQMWITELETLSQKYNDYKSAREKNMCEKVTSSKVKSKPKPKKLKLKM